MPLACLLTDIPSEDILYSGSLGEFPTPKESLPQLSERVQLAVFSQEVTFSQYATKVRQKKSLSYLRQVPNTYIYTWHTLDAQYKTA